MNAELVKELRDSTGLSFNEIKKALDESGGDRAKALEALKARGATVAEKKSQRTTGQGMVEAYIHSNKKVGVLVELLCETDFVVRNPLFGELAHEIAMHIAAMDTQNTDELLTQPYIRDQAITINQLITQYIAKLGENIRVGKFCRLQL